jgi:hypothetical protein
VVTTSIIWKDNFDVNGSIIWKDNFDVNGWDIGVPFLGYEEYMCTWIPVWDQEVAVVIIAVDLKSIPMKGALRRFGTWDNLFSPFVMDKSNLMTSMTRICRVWSVKIA